MQQHELRQPQGATHKRKRVGRGNASGHGTYSGKGLKGQKARADLFHYNNPDLIFKAHLQGCRSCLAYLEQMRLTIRTVGSLSEDEIPVSALESLLGAFRRWKST